MAAAATISDRAAHRDRDVILPWRSGIVGRYRACAGVSPSTRLPGCGKLAGRSVSFFAFARLGRERERRGAVNKHPALIAPQLAYGYRSRSAEQKLRAPPKQLGWRSLDEWRAEQGRRKTRPGANFSDERQARPDWTARPAVENTQGSLDGGGVAPVKEIRVLPCSGVFAQPQRRSQQPREGGQRWRWSEREASGGCQQCGTRGALLEFRASHAVM